MKCAGPVSVQRLPHSFRFGNQGCPTTLVSAHFAETGWATLSGNDTEPQTLSESGSSALHHLQFFSVQRTARFPCVEGRFEIECPSTRGDERLCLSCRGSRRPTLPQRTREAWGNQIEGIEAESAASTQEREQMVTLCLCGHECARPYTETVRALFWAAFAQREWPRNRERSLPYLAQARR